MAMKIGIAIKMGDDLEERLEWAKQSGFNNCQLQLWDMAHLCSEHALGTKRLLAKYGIEATSLWCGWHGPVKWNFREGPAILGIVPPEYRATRTKNLLDGAAYARELGIPDVVTHLGFVPANCSDPNYIGVVNTLKYILEQLAPHKQNFLMETGQETPVILRRLIEDVGSDRLLVNYDPANLMAYGNGDPISGIDILRGYIKSVHAKDARYPVSGYELGIEYPIGKGDADIPRFIRKLKEIEYDGPVFIEHEIEVDIQTQKAEIMEGKLYLEELLKQ